MKKPTNGIISNRTWSCPGVQLNIMTSRHMEAWRYCSMQS